MIFNTHFNLAGRHAFLSASKYHWTNYSDERLDEVFINSLAAQRGTELHAFAHEAIRLGIKLKGTNTLAKYVNDCIGFKMTPEQTLFYSDNCFGHADAINFRQMKLKIFDLKTGVNLCKIVQLEIYAALFCLEYGYDPFELEEIELRLYQNDEVSIYEADPAVIQKHMDTIKRFDKRIEAKRMEVMS